jgi:peptide/nickel transport system ATP-binding protein
MAPLIEVVSATQSFMTRRGRIEALRDVSVGLERSEVLCLVGESGSGKTTLGKMIAGLRHPTAGQVRFEGRDIWTAPRDEFARFRRAVQIVHQDPYASLNPVHRVRDILAAPLERHRVTSGRATLERIKEILVRVDLTPPEDFLDKYPHQLSGGQRQRVSIARALTLDPRVIVADEAVSMVDTSIRVSLLNTLLRLREDLGVAFLFITHDLGIAKYFGWSGSTAVMYLGRVVERAPTRELIARPHHPYTRALLAAIPEPDPELSRKKAKLQLRSLDIPSLLHLPSGCTFHPRCPLFETGLCDVESPPLVRLPDGVEVACHVIEREFARRSVPSGTEAIRDAWAPVAPIVPSDGGPGRTGGGRRG